MLKSAFRSLGVAMVALGLMAMFAVAAQAENLSDGGKVGRFLVLGSSALVAGTTFSGTLLHFIKLVGSKNAYILCTEGHITGKGISESEILFEILLLGCKAFNDTTKAELTACPVEETKFTGIGKAKLHEGKLYILFQNENEKVFEEDIFGPECGIGIKVKLTGSFVGEVDNGNAANDHLITFSEAIQKLFQVNGVGDKLLYGNAEAFIIGVAHLHPTGAHPNCTWAVD